MNFLSSIVDLQYIFNLYHAKNSPYCAIVHYTYTKRLKADRLSTILCCTPTVGKTYSGEFTVLILLIQRTYKNNNNSRGYNIVTFYRSRTYPHTNGYHTRTHSPTRTWSVPDEISNSFFAFRPNTFACETNDNEQNRDLGQ